MAEIPRHTRGARPCPRQMSEPDSVRRVHTGTLDHCHIERMTDAGDVNDTIESVLNYPSDVYTRDRLRSRGSVAGASAPLVLLVGLGRLRASLGGACCYWHGGLYGS